MILFLILFEHVIGNLLIEGKDLRVFSQIGDTQTFEIDINYLQPNTQYEIKVSYLGTLATHISLTWDCFTSQRKLLDTEKLIFTTDDQKRIHGGCKKISLKVSRNSRSISKQSSETPVWFIIKLESFNKAFLVPNSVMPLIISLISFLFLVPALFFYLKSNLKKYSSDLKLESKIN